MMDEATPVAQSEVPPVENDVDLGPDLLAAGRDEADDQTLVVPAWMLAAVSSAHLHPSEAMPEEN